VRLIINVLNRNLMGLNTVEIYFYMVYFYTNITAL